MSLSDKIKYIRNEYGYFQKELSDKLNEHYKLYKKINKLTKNVIFRQVDISNMENKSSEGVSQYKTMFLITFFYEKHDVSPEYFFLEKKRNNNNTELIEKYEKYIEEKFLEYDKTIIKLKNNLKNDLINFTKRNH